MFTLLKGDFCMKIIEGCKNLKKYNKLSIAVSGMIALCGCGAVAAADNYSEGTAVVTTVESTNEPTTEPFAYAGYGYKQQMKEQEELAKAESATEATTEPFAYAGYGYKQQMKEQEKLAETVPTTEPFAYAGYGYEDDMEEQETNILYSTAVKSPDGKYMYNRYDACYRLTNEDSLEDVCNKLNITVEEFYEHNADITYKAGDVISYPVMDEYYIAHAGDNINEISAEVGINPDKLISDNKDMGLSGLNLVEDTYLFLHQFSGNENSYRNNKGIVNIIENNRIYGDKVIQASGFAGASAHYLVLDNSVYSYGVNTVSCYTFDGESKFSSDIICFNVKDIINVGGMPVAIFRNDDDIKELADSVSVEVNDMAHMQWDSYNSSDYPVYTNGDVKYIAMNGMEMGNIDLDKTLVKTR